MSTDIALDFIWWQLITITYSFIVLSITQSVKDFITQFVELVRANIFSAVRRRH
ncbi:TPA: hypothetical protein JAW23_004717 [Citrobacter koseri]|nr:hypothetical protein [Citrobacter koseri]HAT7567205.1 hypothetical protein [Citrobacter koseri]